MKTNWMHALALTCLMAGSTLTATAQQAPAATDNKQQAVDELTLTLKRILDSQKSIENKLLDMQKRVDAISQFLGSDRSSSFDSMDRRLKNMEDDLRDIKRSVDRR